jgi:putative drug exporter of the RND superfamily
MPWLRWVILAAWLVLLSVGGVLALSVNSVLSGGGWYAPGSQSQQTAEGIAAADLLGRNQTPVTVVISSDRYDVSDPAFARGAEVAVAVLGTMSALDVRSSYGWTTVAGEAREHFVGKDRRTVLESVGLGLSDNDARRELPAAQKTLSDQLAGSGMSATLVSSAAMWADVNRVSQEDLIRAELFCLPLIVLILLLLFRSVAAAGVSLLVGISSIVMTLGLVSLIARQVEMSIFVENTATMLGLGVAVDYSLFVISRHLEELRRTGDVTTALIASIKTSGHTVVFSGLTVVLTMAMLFFVDLNVIKSIAAGAVLVVAFAVLNATLVLPAILHLLGPRIAWGSIPRRRGATRSPADEGRRWAALVTRVMRRPAIFGVLVTAALLVVAAPALSLKTFSPDARILPDDSPVRSGYDMVQEQFGVGQTSPIQILVHADRPLWQQQTGREVVELEDELSQLSGVVEVQSPASIAQEAGIPLTATQMMAALPDSLAQGFRNSLSADGRTFVITLLPDGAPASQVTRDLVTEVRSVTAGDHPGLDLVVGGETAEGIDANAVIADALPKVIVAMLGVIYLVLLITFRSLLLPLKAVAMNLLSVGATYGVLVAVFQWGWGADLLGLTQTGNLMNFVPVLLLALLLSLSTDYEVFLLGRVREEYLISDDNTAAVVEGVRRTAPLISGAAILMVAVFGAFAFTGMVPIEQLGLGMAVGVLLDATVIRLLLVPAAMKLMGRANWWLPFAGRRSYRPRRVLATEPTAPAPPSEEPTEPVARRQLDPV